MPRQAVRRLATFSILILLVAGLIAARPSQSLARPQADDSGLLSSLQAETGSTATSDEDAQAGKEPAEKQLETTREISKTSLRDLAVKLIDEDGQPVSGAKVMPYAMRMVENNAHGFWDREVLGPPVDYESDASGVATIRYPGKTFNRPKPYTTSLVTFQIRHFNFVTQTVHLELGPDYDNPITETEVQLKRGCELEVSAADEAGNTIEQYAVLMAGDSYPTLWEEKDTGVRRTSALDDGTRQILLVAPQDDGPTLFSGVRPLRVRPGQALKLRGIKLRPGATLTGRLSADVPRPVRAGHVIVTAAPRPQERNGLEEERTLTWHDWAEVQPDGSFRIESLPRGGKVQVIAVCDDWVCTTTLGENDFFVEGQLFDLNEGTTDIEVQMERTGTLELELLTPDKEPLDSGVVSSWPNQRFYKGGSTILGQRFRSLQFAKTQISPETESISFERSAPFLEQPVKAGRCILKGIPTGKRYGLAIDHPDFKFLTVAGEEPRFILKDENPLKMSLTVVPHESKDAAEALQEAAEAIKNAVKGLTK